MFKFFAAFLLFLFSLQADTTVIEPQHSDSSKFEELFPRFSYEIPSGIDIKPFENFSVSLPIPTTIPENLFLATKNEEGTPDEVGQYKVLTYNMESEKTIGYIPEVAVANSDALIPCSENDGCEYYNQNPSATPTIVPTPTLTPLPTPSPYIAPITPISDPDPIKCSDRLCPMIACVDLNNRDTLTKFDEDCWCPCVPPPIY